MLGIDIHCYYQRAIDWATVGRGPVKFAWIKVSDGGRAYTKTVDGKTYRPATQVAGAHSVGIPVGGYHYAQLSPSPEDQADLLTAEVRRLGATGLPPALDLEAPFVPGKAAREFAIRFLNRLRHNGFPRVTVYANTSMFAAIRPDTWDIGGLLIWAADYGANNGTRNPDLRPYTGRADIHQYTSAGSVAGIVGRVDLNESLTPLHPNQEDGMSWNEKFALDPDGPGPRAPSDSFSAAEWLTWTNHYAAEAAAAATRTEIKVDALTGALSDDEANLLAAIRAQAGGGITPEQHAAILREQLPAAVLAALLALAHNDTEETV